MEKNKIKLMIIFSLAVLLVSGCSVRFSSSEKKAMDPNTDGGVFASADKGSTWKQVSFIKNISGKQETFRQASAYDLAMDPNDPKTLYLGTVSHGLYYTYTITDGWQKAASLPLSEVKVVAIDPKDKCSIYAAGGNRVFKSEDCSRNWFQIYYDNDPKADINSIAIDHHNSDIIYIGLSRGDVLKSSDMGESWQPIFRAKDDVLEIALSPFDSRIVFVATQNKGTARSMDGGMTWQDLEDNMSDFKNSKKFRDLAIATDKEGVMFMATTYGLLRSNDYGDSWSRVELLTPEKESTINAITLAPNSDQIYYVTDTAFYRSGDGGVSWSVVNLPSSRSGQDLLVSPDNPDIIYLTVKGEK
ncbi:hypothetical protein GF382_02135 [Candidatus Falkowbacteria bacterium]|nr:hypothetical protein [Candidatus Falkowbacteria bacterium]